MEQPLLIFRWVPGHHDLWPCEKSSGSPLRFVAPFKVDLVSGFLANSFRSWHKKPATDILHYNAKDKELERPMRAVDSQET